MAVKIKLKRMGKIRSPHYRIIVADARSKRDGRAIEEIGKYHPKESPSLIDVKSERAQYWLGVGAQPTEPVIALLRVTGDWQKFKGLPGAEGTLKSAEPKADKSEKYNALLAEVHKDDDKGEGAKKRTTKKSAAKKTAKSAEKTEAKSDDKATTEDKPEAKSDDKAEAKSDDKTTADDKAADEGKAEDAKPAKKTAAKKAPAKKSAAKKAPAKKTTATKAASEDADKADAPAEES